VRFVDAVAALAVRRFAAGESVVIEVGDAFCPWNAGRWLRRMRCSRESAGVWCPEIIQARLRATYPSAGCATRPHAAVARPTGTLVLSLLEPGLLSHPIRPGQLLI